MIKEILANITYKKFGKLIVKQYEQFPYWARRNKNKTIKDMVKRLSRPYVMFYLMINRNKNIFTHVEMDITTRCTLTCKDCSHLIPRYKEQSLDRDYSIEELQENIDLFIQKMDCCFIFKLVGGEPFLNKQLHKLIEQLVSSKKIKQVQIATNGTILPVGENFNALKNKKVRVVISNYGKLSAKKDELMELLKNEGVDVSCPQYEAIWRKTGDFTYRDYTLDKMKELLNNCTPIHCRTLYKGSLWLCPRVAHGVALGLLEENEAEFIDLRQVSKKELCLKIRTFYTSNSFNSCYYCNGGDLESATIVPCAEQIKIR